MPQAIRSIGFGILVSSLVSAHIARADDPLHVRVDQLVGARAQGLPISALADDAEFLRRVYLDLAGRIPSVQEAREFLERDADDRPDATDKRARLVDRLLAGPDYPRRMQEVAHVMLMERRGDQPDWLAFLRASFEANKPLDQLVREILNPDAKDEATRGAGFFYSKRLEKYGENPIDYPGLTRDVSRLFLGMDLQCAQCHDHLFVSDYKQKDFQGLFAFFLNTSLRSDVKFPAVNEKVMTEKIEFQSVFKKEKHQTAPRVPGSDEIEIEVFERGQEFAEPPDRKSNFAGKPKFSPLAKLAEQLPAADNAAFARNMANRLWFIMMGRGLVHPLDLHHSENPPSHPELLDLLACEFIAHQFNVKWLLHELALTQTYQRSSRFPRDASDPPPELFLVANEKAMSAEQLLWSVLQATGPEAVTSSPMCPPGATFDKLRDKFVKAFANPPGEPEGDFTPSLRAALFVLNDSSVLDCLKPQPGNLIDRLSKLSGSHAVADELYLSILTRQPTDEERAEVEAYLVKHAERGEPKLESLAWALLASTEFCVNH